MRWLRNFLRAIGLRLGIVKPTMYVRDALLSTVINRICCSSVNDGAFIVATETQQGMLWVMSYMRKNNISACALSGNSLGNFRRMNLQGALACMEVDPYKYQVFVMNKNIAAVGWCVPREYQDAWGRVNLLATFQTREPWETQFKGRVRKLA